MCIIALTNLNNDHNKNDRNILCICISKLKKKIQLIIIFQECIYNNEQKAIKYFPTCYDFVVSLTS